MTELSDRAALTLDAGAAHVFGANLNTDDIIAGKYKHRTTDLAELAPHLMENVRPGFRDRVKPGDVLVAGPNFGCGSSREQAPQLLKYVGFRAVVAPSFARIFFRNAVNIGLRLIEVDISPVEEGDLVAVSRSGGRVTHVPSGRSWSVPTLPPELERISEAGGLLAYLRGRDRF